MVAWPRRARQIGCDVETSAALGRVALAGLDVDVEANAELGRVPLAGLATEVETCEM